MKLSVSAFITKITAKRDGRRNTSDTEVKEIGNESISDPSNFNSTATVERDATHKRRSRSDDMATSNLTVRPSKVWEILQKKLDETYKDGWCGVQKDAMVARVRRARRDMGMGDQLRTVESSSYGQMTDTERPFLQNHQAIPNPDKPGEFQRIMVFGNPALFGLLMAENVDLYLDATFTVPPGFYQLLIVMVFDRPHSAYVPVAYVLMTHKTQTLYWHAFASIVVLSEWKLAVRSFTTDFEKALINAAEHQFPEGFHVGCFFHLKQAWRRYLIVKLGFLAEQVKLAMSVGALDLLCIIPQDEVEEFGIPYVRSVIEEGLNADEVAKWDTFWVYFDKQWMPLLDSWNICEEDGSYKKIMNRSTNNGLERHNSNRHNKKNVNHDATSLYTNALPLGRRSNANVASKTGRCPFKHGTVYSGPYPGYAHGNPKRGICPNGCKCKVEINADVTSGESTAQTVLREAIEYLELYYHERNEDMVGKEGFLPKEERMAQVRQAIQETGTYTHTFDELEHGARVAWRNAPKCSNRKYWQQLKLLDCRDVYTNQEMFDSCIKHLTKAVACGSAEAYVTVFRPSTPGKCDGPAMWNDQLLSYAAYNPGDRDIIGDPKNLRFTQMLEERFGWKGPPDGRQGEHDYLPLVIQSSPSDDPQLFEVPLECAPAVHIHRCLHIFGGIANSRVFAEQQMLRFQIYFHSYQRRLSFTGVNMPHV